MKAFFQELDLYKAIILCSLVLLPVVGGWAYVLQGDIEEAKIAVANAKRRGGDLEQIAQHQKAIEEQNRSVALQGSQADSFSTYFDRIIGLSMEQGAGTIGSTDYSITKRGDQRAGRDAMDTLVDIRFNKDVGPLHRGFLMAIMYNAELESPTWKLRKLHIKNAGVSRRAGTRSGPPPVETEDKWLVQEMVFATRKPGER